MNNSPEIKKIKAQGIKKQKPQVIKREHLDLPDTSPLRAKNRL